MKNKISAATLLLSCAHLFNNEQHNGRALLFAEERAPKHIDKRPIWKGKRLTIPKGCRLYFSISKGGELSEFVLNLTSEDGPRNLSDCYFVCVASNIASAQRKYSKFVSS